MYTQLEEAKEISAMALLVRKKVQEGASVDIYCR